MRKIALMVTVVALTAFMSVQAFAENMPSSKFAVALGNLTSLGAASAAANPGNVSDTDDTGWITVARTFIKTPNDKELAFWVSIQAGLVTETLTKSKGGNPGLSGAKGTISVRIKVTDEGNVVRYAAPLESEDPELGVRLAERFQEMEAHFAGLNCTADLGTGEVTCTDPEDLRLLLETLNANAFNFLLANVGPGVKTVELQARAQADANVIGTDLGTARAEAFVGYGSLIVETIRLISGEDGTPVIQIQ